MRPSDTPRTASFPRPPLFGALALLCVALLAAGIGRLSGVSTEEAPTARRIASRDLRFLDRADGAVLVFDADADADAAAPVAVETGENGFLRGTLRGFARTRHADGIGPEVPFRLTAYADGRLTLVDPPTGRHTDLEAFGSTNVLVFARLLQPYLPAPASLTQPVRAVP